MTHLDRQQPTKLGVNLDHIATLRQQRKEDEPNLVIATHAALRGGADSITIHLREDRRHIQDKDLQELRAIVPILNLEMAATPEMLAIAKKTKPDYVCLVPEKRQELTTEGGLAIQKQAAVLEPFIKELHHSGITVSVFINPTVQDIEVAAALGASCVELHTGEYAKTYPEYRTAMLSKLQTAANAGKTLGLQINAGHGLKYYNIAPLMHIFHWEELNIGHTIVSRAVFVGLETAVREMKDLIRKNLIS